MPRPTGADDEAISFKWNCALSKRDCRTLAGLGLAMTIKWNPLLLLPTQGFVLPSGGKIWWRGVREIRIKV